MEAHSTIYMWKLIKPDNPICVVIEYRAEVLAELSRPLNRNLHIRRTYRVWSQLLLWGYY